MEDMKEKESRILSWLWPEQPNMCGISANAMRAKQSEIAMYLNSYEKLFGILET